MHTICIPRKVEIVQFSRRTRLLLIRLLALVKWAGNSSSVQKCSVSDSHQTRKGIILVCVFTQLMSTMLNEQSWLYVDTADQLALLARNTLFQAWYDTSYPVVIIRCPLNPGCKAALSL